MKKVLSSLTIMCICIGLSAQKIWAGSAASDLMNNVSAGSGFLFDNPPMPPAPDSLEGRPIKPDAAPAQSAKSRAEAIAAAVAYFPKVQNEMRQSADALLKACPQNGAIPGKEDSQACLAAAANFSGHYASYIKTVEASMLDMAEQLYGESAIEDLPPADQRSIRQSFAQFIEMAEHAYQGQPYCDLSYPPVNSPVKDASELAPAEKMLLEQISTLAKIANI